MDKYEYRVKAEQIVKLAGRKNYVEAMKIADEIDWNRVKNVQMLCTVSDIYAKNERYEESREILYLAFDRSPTDRIIIYNIVELSLLLGDMKEAVDYFREYSQLAVNDPNIYVLKYKLYAANSNTSIETLISILEEFKEQEFHEDWGFELARLYADGGYIEQCVELCDELDLWFNEGPYVLQALELKQQFAPLTSSQQSKLEQSYAMLNEAEQMQQMFAEEQTYMQEKEEQARMQQQAEQMHMQQQEEQARMQMQEEQTRMQMQEEQARMQMQEEQTRMQMQEEQARMQMQEEQARMQMQEEQAYMQMQEEQARMQEKMQAEQMHMQEKMQAEQARMQEKMQAEQMHMQEKFQDNQPMQLEEDIFFAGKMSSSVPTGADVPLPDLETTAEGLRTDVRTKDDSIQNEPETWTIPDRSIVINEGEANESLEVINDIGNKSVSKTQADENKMSDDKEKSDRKHRSGGIFSTIGRLSKMLVEPSADYDAEDEDEDEETNWEENSNVAGESEEIEQKEEIAHTIQEPSEKKFVNSGRFKFDDIAAAQRAYEASSAKEENAVKEEKNEKEDIIKEELSKIVPEKAHVKRDTKPFDKVAFKEKKSRKSYEEDIEDALKNIDKVVNGRMDVSKVKDSAIEEATPVWNGVSRYDTMNLQKELAKSIQKLLEATQKDDVDSTLEDVKRLVEDSNIPELTETMRFRTVRSSMLNNWAKSQADKLNVKPQIEESVEIGMKNYVKEDNKVSNKAPVQRKPDVEVITSLKLKPTKADRKRELEQILTLENDGQIGLVMPKEEVVEKQITGQLNIQDVLFEFERQKDLEITQKEKQELENARNKALNETQEFMSQVMDLLNQCLPKCGDVNAKSVELHKQLAKVQQELNSTDDLSQISELNTQLADILEKICPMQQNEKDAEEPEDKSAEASEEAGEEPQDKAAEALEEATEEPQDKSAEALEEAAEEPQDKSAEASEEAAEEPQDKSAEASEEAAEEPQDKSAEVSEEATEETDEESEEDRVFAQLEEALSDIGRDIQRVSDEIENKDDELIDAKIESMLEGVEAVVNDADKDVNQNVKNEPAESDKASELEERLTLKALMNESSKLSAASLSGLASSMVDNNLDDKQKEALSYFANIAGVAGQVDKLLNVDKKGSENMIIIGPDGSGKTSLALRIIKARQGKDDKELVVAKIKGASLNSQDINDVFEKVNGGVLVIEKAAALSDTTMKKICNKLDAGDKIQIILVTKKKSVERLIARNSEFMNRFKVTIDLPNYNNDELVEYGKTYAKECGYEIEDMAVLALFSRLGVAQPDHGSPNFNDVKQIIDEAVYRAERRKKKIIKRLFGKKSEDFSSHLLEEDFE